MPSTASLPSLLDSMSTREVILELRDTPNPQTGKPHHTLTEISRAAGASKGWCDYVLHRSAKGRHESRFDSTLRRYLKKLRTSPSTTSPMPEVESRGIRRIPREEFDARKNREQPARVQRVAYADLLPDPASPPPPTPQVAAPPTDPPKEQPAPVSVRTEQRETVAANGMRIKEKVTTKVTKTTLFAEQFEGIKDRLWAQTTEIDTLIANAPKVFRPGLEDLRDRLLTILQDIES